MNSYCWKSAFCLTIVHTLYLFTPFSTKFLHPSFKLSVLSFGKATSLSSDKLLSVIKRTFQALYNIPVSTFSHLAIHCSVIILQYLHELHPLPDLHPLIFLPGGTLPRKSTTLTTAIIHFATAIYCSENLLSTAVGSQSCYLQYSLNRY